MLLKLLLISSALLFPIHSTLAACTQKQLDRVEKIQKIINNTANGGLSLEKDIADIKLHIVYVISGKNDCDWSQAYERWYNKELQRVSDFTESRRERGAEIQKKNRELYKMKDADLLNQSFYIGLNKKIKVIDAKNLNLESDIINQINSFNLVSDFFDSSAYFNHSIIVSNYSLSIAHYTQVGEGNNQSVKIVSDRIPVKPIEDFDFANEIHKLIKERKQKNAVSYSCQPGSQPLSKLNLDSGFNTTHNTYYKEGTQILNKDDTWVDDSNNAPVYVVSTSEKWFQGQLGLSAKWISPNRIARLEGGSRRNVTFKRCFCLNSLDPVKDDAIDISLSYFSIADDAAKISLNGHFISKETAHVASLRRYDNAKRVAKDTKTININDFLIEGENCLNIDVEDQGNVAFGLLFHGNLEVKLLKK